MNKTTLQAGKIVSLSKDGNWAQPLSLENFFCSLELFGPPNFETPLLGRELIEEIQKRYFTETEKNLEFLKNLLFYLKEKTGQEVKLNMAVLLRNDSILYLGTINSAKVLIKRGDKLLTILNGEKEIETASGLLKDKDKIILETESFAKIINEEKLNQALDNRSAQEVVDILAPQVQSEENFGGAAMIIEVKLIEEDEEEKETERTFLELNEEKEPPSLREEEAVTRKENLLLKIKEKIKPLLVGLFKKLASFVPQKPIYVKNQETDRQKKVIQTVALILLILFVVSIFFNLRKKTLGETEVKFNEAYSYSLKKQEEAKLLIDLNPVRSRTLFKEAKKSLEEVSPLITKNKKQKEKLEKLLKEIEKDLEIVAKIYRLRDLDLFFDLTLIKDRAIGKALAIDDRNLYVYDSFNKSLYLVNISNKSQKILASGKDLEKGKSLTFANNKVFVLTEREVLQINSENQEKRAIIKIDKGKEEITDIAPFFNNIYLLDKKNNRIWKYILGEGEPSVKNYLTEGLNPDFSQAVSFTIDGAIYVLRSDGEILKFIQGSPEGFKISGLDTDLDNPTAIYTNEDLKRIYILDSGNNRIVTVDKKGEYQSQYVHKEIGKTEDVVVDREEKNLYLLSGSKIYKIEIK